MDKARSIWLFILFCALAPVPAQALNNQINAISVTPSPAQPNQTVAITVDVVGPEGCAFTLDFGDGQSTTSTAAKGPITHAYDQTRVLTATPAALFPCTGSATVTLPVLQTTGMVGAVYCAINGCNPTISAMPLSLPEPGNTVIFQGSGFGFTAGTAWMVLQSYSGSQKRVQLGIEPGYWQPGVVVATITSQIGGVVDQTATFQIVTAGGSGSNGYNVPFVAWRDYGDIDATRIGCSMTKNTGSDGCQFNGGTNFNQPFECVWGIGLSLSGTADLGPATGFWGNHLSGWQLTAGANDAGVDTFFLTSPLQNGWLLDNADISSVGASDNHTFINILNPPNLYFGGPTANPSSWQIGWNVDACGILSYTGEFNIIGPIGVPF